MQGENNQNENGRVFKDLKRLVNEYLAKTPMAAVGPRRIYLKSAFLACSWILTYILLLTIGPASIVAGIFFLALLLLLTCGIEFCIMHDASHKALSKNQLFNKLALNGSLAIMGGCSLSWHQEHVVRHHGYTNILGSDPDVYASHVIRIHPSDKWYWWHRWQHLYSIPLYSFMWLHWVFNDLINASFNSYKLSMPKLLQFWMLIFIGLVPHVTLMLVLPYLAFQNLWIVAAGYLFFFMSLSIVMAMTFVLAHVSNTQQFYTPDDDTHKDWAIHQLETTTDFAVDNRFLTWLLGGLNFQVEHHIFPAICHLHYPAIQKIVKSYCQEHGIVYNEEKTLWSAVCSHVAHLKAMSVPQVSLREEESMALCNEQY